LILELASKSGYDVPMFTLHKGDCENCGHCYHYTLLHAGFGDYSYAYCDRCGALATFDYSSSILSTMPPISVPHQVIDAEWEPFIRPCECGGHFRKQASPRCVHCNQVLSAELATAHIERNSAGAPRGWRWQKNWTDSYCIDIENPRSPGTLRQVSDPFIVRGNDQEKPTKGRWLQVFSLSR
jgi:hypothetical protein